MRSGIITLCLLFGYVFGYSQKYSETLHILQITIDLAQECVNGLLDEENVLERLKSGNSGILEPNLISGIEKRVTNIHFKLEKVIDHSEKSTQQAYDDGFFESWKYSANSTKLFNDAEKFIYRLRLKAGNIKNADDLTIALNYLNSGNDFILQAMEEIRNSARWLE